VPPIRRSGRVDAGEGIEFEAAAADLGLGNACGGGEGERKESNDFVYFRETAAGPVGLDRWTGPDTGDRVGYTIFSGLLFCGPTSPPLLGGLRLFSYGLGLILRCTQKRSQIYHINYE
jgi:hypothetical protein